jgi:hypothetical protein
VDSIHTEHSVFPCTHLRRYRSCSCEGCRNVVSSGRHQTRRTYGMAGRTGATITAVLLVFKTAVAFATLAAPLQALDGGPVLRRDDRGRWALRQLRQEVHRHSGLVRSAAVVMPTDPLRQQHRVPTPHMGSHDVGPHGVGATYPQTNGQRLKEGRQEPVVWMGRLINFSTTTTRS